MAHAPLLRTQTAPVYHNSTSTAIGAPGGIANPKTPFTNMMSARTSQLSGSTAFAGSTSSLASLSSSATIVAPPTSNLITNANIINQKADASRSLYQICIALKQRLALVPGFDEYLSQLDPLDPVDSLWDILRTGHPLLAIFNALRPAEPLRVEDYNDAEPKRSKKAIFKFIQGCLKDLQMPSGECFVIKDLTSEDTTGFVKVTQVVNRVLDIAELQGFLLESQPGEATLAVVGGPGVKMSQRQHIIKETVDTERKYVQDLENLYDLKKTLEQRGIIAGDIVHQIFLNMNAIIDFQRRFLIRIESVNSMPNPDQHWGAPFVLFESFFDTYLPYIANQRKGSQVATDHFDKIRLADHPVAMDLLTFTGFLSKPMQRLTKYPLLLKTLLKASDDELKADLTAGLEASERVLMKANESINQDMLDEALEDLINRVDDWKSHKVEQFGKLLLHGIYGVITGKSDTEKDYEIYLFENILLCCKEIVPAKTKDKKAEKTKSLIPKPPNKSVKLQLKGRIFMTNVTDVVTISKPGSHSVQIWWKGDPGVENFTVRFTQEDMMRKWAAGLETQRKENAPRGPNSPEVMSNDFTWTATHAGNLENPYVRGGDEEEREDDIYPGASHFGPPSQSSQTTMSRNPSYSSLRQRSATNESSASLASMVRAQPPRFPMQIPNPPASLSLQTQTLSGGQRSPDARGGDSYFSPVAESPPSSRTSTTSGVFPTPTSAYSFPRNTPSWEENNRYTAPAMPRAPSRDGTPNGQSRNPRGPSLPAMASNSSQNAAQMQRSRSYSTADINGIPTSSRRSTQGSSGGSGVPAVPGIPAHLHEIPRSQTASPRAEHHPARTSTQSPSTHHRERSHQHSGSYGGTMSHFPTHPIYPSRQHTPNPSQGGNGPALTIDSAATYNSVIPGYPTGGLPTGGFPTGGLPTGVSYVSNSLSSPDFPPSSQLKVKVSTDNGAYLTLVAAFNITYQSLVDRIDAKLARVAGGSIGKGNLKLRYKDEDGDFITIQSDDDIQIAFLEWREAHSSNSSEIELFCVRA